MARSSEENRLVVTKGLPGRCATRVISVARSEEDATSDLSKLSGAAMLATIDHFKGFDVNNASLPASCVHQELAEDLKLYCAPV